MTLAETALVAAPFAAFLGVTALARLSYSWGRRIGASEERTLLVGEDAQARAASYLLSERGEMLSAIEEVVGIATWMSGSSDFGPEGKARDGWRQAQPRLIRIEMKARFWRGRRA